MIAIAMMGYGRLFTVSPRSVGFPNIVTVTGFFFGFKLRRAFDDLGGSVSKDASGYRLDRNLHSWPSCMPRPNFSFQLRI
jgi:hypothetical protein